MNLKIRRYIKFYYGIFALFCAVIALSFITSQFRSVTVNAITYSEFVKKNIKDVPEFTIPKFVFRTAKFKIDNLPAQVRNILMTTMRNSPEYIQVYLDDDEHIQFIREEFPEYLNAYLSIIPGAYKADIVRLLLIYRYGGIYNDIGNKYLKPIHQYVNDNDELVLTKDHIQSGQFSICNGFIGAYKKHPIIKSMIDLVMYNVDNRRYGDNYLDIAGPNAIGRAFNRFFDKEDFSEFRDGVFTIPKESQTYKIKVFYRDGRFIKLNGAKFIRYKFSKYSKIMYENTKIPHYAEYWNNRNVYQ